MKKLLTLLFLCTTTLLFSENFSIDLVKNMKPRNMGPGGMFGCVTKFERVIRETNALFHKDWVEYKTLKFLLLKN
jgi:hypothetical protein